MNSASHARSRALVRNLHSVPAEVDSFCLDVRELLRGAELASEVFPVEMLLRESLNNALIHGNCCDCTKMIRAEVKIGRKWIVLRVGDEGAGFNCRKARRAAPDPDATCGRGLAIYSLYAHRVCFNSKGNQVSLWRAVTGDKVQ